MKEVTIYTDGSSRGNPGPGGFGTVLIHGEYRKKLAGGFKRTTNNRMEIFAAIAGIEALQEPCTVTVYSDSQYLVNAMSKGWIQGWRKRGWKRPKDEALKNADLWQRMWDAVSGHKVTWKWVRGHAGNEFNEICDQLAVSAATGKKLAVDEGFVD
ncbi:MAG: ribonuclease HI [Verrucomicrobiales bacterium]|jgi:ribonuclease HI